VKSSQACSQTRAACGYLFPQPDSVKAASASKAASAVGAVQIFRSSPATAAASRRATGRSAFRMRWTLCRHRHKVHYADLRVMPTSRRELQVAA
jgi:hypothetical protein